MTRSSTITRSPIRTEFEYVTLSLALLESDRRIDPLFGPRAIEQAIHDESERVLNNFGASGWDLACVTRVGRKRGALGRYLFVMRRHDETPVE